MSVKATSVINKSSVAFADGRTRVVATLTLPSAYPTNGFDVSQASGLFPSLTFEVGDIVCASSTSNGNPVFYDKTNAKIKVFSAIGTEVSNATDLSAQTLTVVAKGF